MTLIVTPVKGVCLFAALLMLIIHLPASAQFPAFPPTNVTAVQDRDQMMWQQGFSFLSLPPKAQDKYKPPFTWPASMSDPEGNWIDSFGHTITRGGHGLWNNYDDYSTVGILPAGHNGNLLDAPQPWRVGNYAPIDLLKMNNGSVITTAAQWWNQRRPEIAKDAAEQMWGVMPADSILPNVKYVVTTTTGWEPTVL